MRPLVALLALFLGLAGPVKAAGVDEIVIANAEFTLWHQAARGITAQNARPPTPDDRMAILYALHRLSLGDDALDVERLLLVAHMWLEAEARGEPPIYLRIARLDGALARLILCYVAGEGPGPAHVLMAEWGPPVDGGADCEVTFAERLDEAAAFYDAYLPAGDGRVSVEGGPDPLAAVALRLVANGISRDFGLPQSMRLRTMPCEVAMADYSDTTQTVTLCQELMEAYVELAQSLAGP